MEGKPTNEFVLWLCSGAEMKEWHGKERQWKNMCDFKYSYTNKAAMLSAGALFTSSSLRTVPVRGGEGSGGYALIWQFLKLDTVDSLSR